MASNGKRNHYSNLPKKELQNLCKRHGLPTDRSKSDLVSSLAPYLQGPSVQEDSAAGIISKDSNSAKDDRTENVFINGIATSEANLSPAKEDYGSLAKTSEEAPHSYMKFQMWDDEGINLVVDLKASPLGWTKMFKQESAEPVCETMPHSPKEDLTCLDKNGKDMTDDDELNGEVTGYDQQQCEKFFQSAWQNLWAVGASLSPLGSIGIKSCSGAEDGGVNSIELNLDSNGNSIPSIVEGQGARNNEGKENLKCSQLDNSVERMSSKYFVSEKVPDRKRKDGDAADRCADDNPAPTNAVYLRRSSRLKSKGVFRK